MARADFWIQTDALLRKNLTFQKNPGIELIRLPRRTRGVQFMRSHFLKRNKCSSITIIVGPIILCVLLYACQIYIDFTLKTDPKNNCGCIPNTTKECAIQDYSHCPTLHPTQWPPLLQIPAPQFRAVRTDFPPFSDLPDSSCRKTQSCPVSILLTATNRSFAQSLGQKMLATNNIIGSATVPRSNKILDSAFSTSSQPLYQVQSECINSLDITVPIEIGKMKFIKVVKCAKGQFLWRNSSSEINKELYKGYLEGNPESKINEFVAGYDFLNSNGNTFNVSVWYNATSVVELASPTEAPQIRVSRLLNWVSNAYLEVLFQKTGAKVEFEFVKEMPIGISQISEPRIDLSSLTGAPLFTFIIIGLFPPVLTLLVYENQNRLQMMMKMHGLGDGPYWFITYSYFLALSAIYMLCFALFGSLTGMRIFTSNDYGLQSVFYFLYVNLQISVAFLLAPFFIDVSTARVTGYMIVFASGLLGASLFIPFVENQSFPREGIIVMELFPGFSLYRGLYEFGEYANAGSLVGSRGMKWEHLNDTNNGMKEVLLIMFVEWLIVLAIAYYFDQAALSGKCARKWFASCLPNKSLTSLESGSGDSQVHIEKSDVNQEREKVEQLLQGGSFNEAIITDNLAKVYPARDGNPPKVAVKGVSLALPSGECFGLLGPNGAGKTSFISMMIGLSKPTSGNAFVDGNDILTQMDEIYSNMGVCPQYDLLWESLTGREHLMFYGRLKNLKGEALNQAVEESLKSVNLYHGGVGNKHVGKYSGGMKRRLSVAISLIGNPKVVYMDEPSTGLDPASRSKLWDVVRRAKQDRAIILTTHSMEEAEVLCDRLGIFVDGSLQCIGNPKELKARYGGSFVFTITTSSSHEAEVEGMVRRLSPSAQRIYQISGTQKFELPKQEVRISDVFQAVQEAKNRFTVNGWGLADTTLEDVFIKVARGAQAFNTLS